MSKKRTHTMNSKKVRKVKSKLLLRQGLTCALCQAIMSEHEVSIDHILPISKGGGSTICNMQLAHKKCNNKKSETNAIVTIKNS